MADDYLAGLPDPQKEELTRVNSAGLKALREYLKSGQAVAFLGAGVSAPLYPLWNGLISDLTEAAADRITDREAATCRDLASSSPEEAVEFIRDRLGPASYREVLRKVLQVRTDPDTGRSWTPVQELICRAPFQAVVTTNYDPGIVDARMRVRPGAFATGYTTWEDELGLDRWRTGDVFGDDELPVLFAHGQHNRPDSIVLATTEYRRAYAGKLPHVLARLMDGHLIWIGFSFADQRIAAILREIANQTGTRIDPGGAPRHVAIMSWDPDAPANDPGVLARRAEVAFGANVILYPAPNHDHSALATLLAAHSDPRFPAALNLTPTADPLPSAVADSGLPERWVPPPDPIAHFTGRAEELAKLDRWAADPQVALIGVTAWGGAGKTALVTHWAEHGNSQRPPGLRGVFGWSFYTDPSPEDWAAELLNWARHLGVVVTGTGRTAAKVLDLLRAVPLLLILDGLEVVQEGPSDDQFGRLLDGLLREVLAGVCQQPSGGLVLLTSRSPFADLESFDGSSARMLDVPPFTPAEGAELLGIAGGGWLPEPDRQDLVSAVDGHALAVSALAGLLADRPPAADLAALRAELTAATRTDARVGKVLAFYADRLAEPDRYLLAAVSLFARPVSASAVLTVSQHEAFGARLAGWDPAMVQAAVRGRLGGLATWHPDGTISAHPLVRDTFRPLGLAAAQTAADTALDGLPDGEVTSRADALRVVEAIELLLDAGHWQPANDLYRRRSRDSDVWKHLPAARLGQRAATAFVATPQRRDDCAAHLTPRRLSYFLGTAGLYAMSAGDTAAALDYLQQSASLERDDKHMHNLAISLDNLGDCLGDLGQIGQAREAIAEALSCAQASGEHDLVGNEHVSSGWLAGLTGDTERAEWHFAAADQIEYADDPDGDHLYALRGVRWAEWLAHTGRTGPATTLTIRNADLCRQQRWNEDVARCERALGRLALAAEDIQGAGRHLAAAIAGFRDGDYLTELAEALPVLATWALMDGDQAAAERYLTEALTIATPRNLIPAQVAALTVRAQVRAARAATVAEPADLLYQGRDAADAALHLATRHQLAWRELEALRAHAALDQAEGTNHDWAAKADALHARLVPPGLDPDPLGTVERLVAEQKASGADPPEL